MYVNRERKKWQLVRLHSGGIWQLQSIFLLPTVIRPAESHKHKELCFGSGYRLLLWHREGEAEGERGGLKGEKGEIGSKERARKGRVPALPPVYLRSLHPSLHQLPPSCSLPLLPSSWLVFYPSRERPLWWCRLRNQCVFKLRTESLSKPCPWIHTYCLLAPFLPSLWSSFSSSKSPPLSLDPPYLSLLFFCHLPLLPTVLTPSLTPAVTPVSSPFGPAFQSSFNWLGVTCSWDDRSSPPGEVDMFRYGALPTPTGLHSQQWLAAGY